MKKISKVLVLSLMMSILCTFNIFAEDNVTFTDVPINSPYYTAVEYLVDNGVVKGCGNGVFNPNNEITLNQFATMLVRAFEPVERKSGPLPVAFSNGWISMYVVSQEPNTKIQSGAVLESLLKAANIDVYSQDNIRTGWEDYLRVVKEWGLLNDDISTSSFITRGEVANLFYMVMTNDYIDLNKPDVLEKINIVNTTSQNTGDYVYYLSKVPSEILDIFDAKDWTFKIDNSEIAKYNYENSSSAVGLCSYMDKTIYVNCQNPTVHEFGHFIDYATDGVVGLDKLFTKEGSAFEEFVMNGISSYYYGKYDVANSAEYFAEYFEKYINYKSDDKVMENLKKATPETFEYFSNLESNGWAYELIVNW